MLEIMYVIQFTGMIFLPIIAGIILGRRLKLSWKLFLAGGLTFIASQVLHIPLVAALTKTFLSWGNVAYAIVLGLLAGIFEETARYILYKFILKKARSWNEGVFVGLGHGGTEAILLGFSVVVSFIAMLGYRSIDLSTVPSIPPEQLELAKQQVAAFWSAPVYVPLLGIVERIFAICLHIALSLMVLYGIKTNKAIWYWLAVLWHAIVDAVAVILGVNGMSAIALEGVVGLFAVVSLFIVFWMKPKFASAENISDSIGPAEAGAG